MTSVDVLFQPVDLGKLKVPNRIVMAPMTRSFSPGHVPGPEVAAYYRRRAEGAVGLILTEGVSTNVATATGTPNVPNVVTDDAKAGWKNVVSEVHGAGGRIGRPAMAARSGGAAATVTDRTAPQTFEDRKSWASQQSNPPRLRAASRAISRKSCRRTCC